jgi:hypothetical protein
MSITKQRLKKLKKGCLLSLLYDDDSYLGNFKFIGYNKVIDHVRTLNLKTNRVLICSTQNFFDEFDIYKDI